MTLKIRLLEEKFVAKAASMETLFLMYHAHMLLAVAVTTERFSAVWTLELTRVLMQVTNMHIQVAALLELLATSVAAVRSLLRMNTKNMTVNVELP